MIVTVMCMLFCILVTFISSRSFGGDFKGRKGYWFDGFGYFVKGACILIGNV